MTRTSYLSVWGAWWRCRRRQALLAQIVEADAAELARLESAMTRARWEYRKHGGSWQPCNPWLAAKVLETGGRVRLA